MRNNYCVYIDKGDNNENENKNDDDDNNKMRKRHFIGVSGGDASNRNIWWNDNIEVSKCNKDRDNDNNYKSNNVINSSKLIN